MNVRERTAIAAASVGCITLAVVLALLLGPREHRMLFAVSGLVAVAMAFPSLFVDPRDLVASLVFAVPPVMALASDGGSAWLIGPLAVLLLVGAELNALCWASQGPPALRTDGRRRSMRIGALALLGLGASAVVALAARVSWLDSTAAVAVAAGALAGLAWVVFPGGMRRDRSAGGSVGVLVVFVCGGIGACGTQVEARPGAGETLSQAVLIDWIEAVEVYTRPAQIPGEFGGPTGNNCGVIVFWTHRGEDGRTYPASGRSTAVAGVETSGRATAPESGR